jgi:hypothetical protein
MHRGYERLGVEVRRCIRLDKKTHSLEVVDQLNGQGSHRIAIPFHLARDVSIERDGALMRLRSAGKVFEITGTGDGWTIDVEPSSISPSYGLALPSQRIVWSRAGPLPAELTVLIRPAREPER